MHVLEKNKSDVENSAINPRGKLFSYLNYRL